MGTFVINSGALTACTGIPAGKLSRWVGCGILTPVANTGNGKGQFREWTLVDLLAVTFALNQGVKKGGWQVPPQHVEGFQALTAFYISRLSEGEVVRAIQEGRVIIANLNGLRLIKPPPGVPVPEHVDLGKVYTRVKEQWEEMEGAMQSEEEAEV